MAEGRNELNVRLAYQWPVDPVEIITMGDYDLSICLTSNWFNYDESRIATPGLIESWKFENGGYRFRIAKNAKWSNGEEITSQHLLYNLKRVVQTSATYGKALSELMDIRSFKEWSPKEFEIKTVDGKPKESFFQRMGSIFFAIVYPPKKGSPEKFDHTVSAGPYVLKSKTQDLLVLERNRYFLGEFYGADVINVKKKDGVFSIDDFLNGQTFEDIVLLTSMLTPSVADKIAKRRLPYWSRGHDRVSLLRPLSGVRLLENRSFLKKIGAHFQKADFGKLTLNVTKALSLQPMGYPLHRNLIIEEDDQDIERRKIRIISSTGPSTDYHKTLLKPLFLSLGLEVDWTEVPKQVFMETLYSEKQKDFDFALYDFGVADPEPATWMGLVLKKKMIESTKEDIDSYAKAIENKEFGREVSELSEILTVAARRGSYLPLFHFSTIVLGKDNIDFKHIRKLDETINYSQLIVK